MGKKKIVLMCREAFIEPFEKNGFEVLWTFPFIYPLLYEGKSRILLEKEAFKARLDSYKEKVLQFEPTYFLAEQWFFTNVLLRLMLISASETANFWIDFIKDLNRKGIRTVIWCRDDPSAFSRKKDLIPLTHSFQVVAAHTAQMEKRYVAHGQRMLYMPNFVTIDYDKGSAQVGEAPTDGSGDNFKSDFDLFFDGSMNPDRRLFFYRLSKRVSGLDYFFGNNEFHYTSRKKIDFDTNNKEHLKRIYRSTKINLIYGAMCDTPFNKCWGVPDRVFNITYCTGFFLHGYRRHLNSLLKTDPGLYTFRNIGECHRKIRLYLRDNNLRKEMAAGFHKQTMERHTVERRIAQFIHDIER